MPTLEEIKEQIKDIPQSQSFFSKKEVKELPSLLYEDEVVEHMMSGVYGDGIGVIFATNKRLLFVDKSLFKLRVEDFPYEKISSIQYKLGLFMGQLEIFTSNNKAQIKNCSKDIVQGFVDKVRQRMSDGNKKKAEAEPAKPSASADDFISKLERLAKLKEQGILTDAEFLQQKEKILNG